MTWFGWVLLAWWLVGVVLIVADVGKPRKPIRPATGAAAVVMFTLLAVGLVTVGTGTGV